ncbi:MAG: MurR/RpiR family transcriptional regulator [Clostridia bacterium]|nr:MurR/RpiR family transcriptional regulator [Clostridia bacterium]
MRNNIGFVNALFKIRDEMDGMTYTQKQIASGILADPSAVIRSSLRRTADRLGVSEGSIIKFANILGFSGYSALRLNIAQCLSPHEIDSPRESSGEHSVLTETMEKIIRSMEVTCDLGNDAAIETASRLLREAKRVEVYGVISSAVVAVDSAFRLMKLGFSVKAETDPITCPLSATLLGPGDAVLVLSATGRTHDVVRAVQIAKDRGASVISVTGNAASPIAKLSDATLLTGDSGASVTNFSHNIRFVQIFLVEALCRHIALSDKERQTERQAEIDRIWAEYYNT